MALTGGSAWAVFLGAAVLLTGACTPRGTQLSPEVVAALRGLTVGPASPSTSLSWRLAEGCRLGYLAGLDGDAVQFSMTGAALSHVVLDYPARLVPASNPTGLLLQTGDDGRQFFVRKVSQAVDENGRAIGKGIAHDVYEVGQEPQPWNRLGSRPGLLVFFPPLPQAPEWEWEWTPMQRPRSVRVRTRVEGWLRIRGETTALISARSDDGRFQGTYLVLASGRLLWASVSVDGQSDSPLQVKLVSACDGPTLIL